MRLDRDSLALNRSSPCESSAPATEACDGSSMNPAHSSWSRPMMNELSAPPDDCQGSCDSGHSSMTGRAEWRTNGDIIWSRQGAATPVRFTPGSAPKPRRIGRWNAPTPIRANGFAPHAREPGARPPLLPQRPAPARSDLDRPPAVTPPAPPRPRTSRRRNPPHSPPAWAHPLAHTCAHPLPRTRATGHRTSSPRPSSDPCVSDSLPSLNLQCCRFQLNSPGS